MATTAAENKEHIRRVEDAINDRDSDAINDIFGDDVVLHLELEEIRGADAYNEYLQGVYEAFPDLTVSFEELVAEDDLVVVRYTLTGTHEGEFNGIEPTGTEVEVSGMRMARVKDGGIVEVGGRRGISACSPSSAPSNCRPGNASHVSSSYFDQPRTGR